MGKRQKINKNTIPEGFTTGLVLVDLLPVLFFGATTLIIGLLTWQPLIYIGAAVCFASGLLKVLWKLIVVKKQKNVWPLFIQMRIAMPVGFVIMLVGFVICLIDCSAKMLRNIIYMPSLLFLIAGGIGMCLMIFFAIRLDSSDLKSNWIEQLTNGIAQFCFFLAFLFLLPGINLSKPAEILGPVPNQTQDAPNVTLTPEGFLYEGFKVKGTELLDANGEPFVMRGVNMAHSWYALQDSVSLQAIAATGANCVRVVCANGDQWNKDTAKGLSAIIDYCKELKLITVLEIHDATGKNDLASLSSIVDYWVEMKEVFPGTEPYCIINIANEWMGGWDDKTWTAGYIDAVKRIREAGIRNTLMVDTGGYGQYGKCIEKGGIAIFEADPLANTMFSIHMYGMSGKNEKTIEANLTYATERNLCICVGEFGHKHTDGNIDEAYLMEYCEKNKIGYMGWSWKGNSGGVEYLDIANAWDGSKLSSDWGEVLINGKNGIRETSKICTVFTKQ